MSRLYNNKFFFIALLLFLHVWLFCIYRPIVDPDSYFHALAANELRTNGEFALEDKLPISIFAKYPNDQHFGYHWLQSWFSSGSELHNLKICQAILASALLLTFLYSAKNLNPSYALWAVCLLISNFAFMSRISTIKASALSILFFISLINGLCFQNLFTILVVPLLFVLCHSGFLVCFFPMLSLALTKPKMSFLTFFCFFIGLVLGLILHPDGLEYLKFLKFQGLNLALMKDLSTKIGVGLEWKAPTFKAFTITNFPILIVALPAFVYGICKYKTLEFKQKLLLMNGIFMAVLYLRSARFIEYFIPSILLYLLSILRLNSKTNKKVILPSLIFAIIWSVVSTKSLVEKKELPMPIVMINWLKEQINSGEMICNLDWADFPELAFNMPNYQYLYGSDPRYLAFADPNLYNSLANFLSSPSETELIRVEEVAKCKLLIVSKKLPKVHAFLKTLQSEKIEFDNFVILIRKVGN